MSEFFLNALEATAGPIVGLAMVLALLFGLLALAGLAWAPFAAVLCARKARGLGMNSWLFAWKGFAFSILYLFPWFYLMSRMEGARASRFWAGFAYSVVYFIWLAVGIIVVSLYIGTEITNLTDPNDHQWWIRLAFAPAINAILWTVSLIFLIRRDRRDREKPAVQSASTYINPNTAASEIIPARACTNPFGFSLFGAIGTLVWGFICIGAMFSS